MGLLHGGTNPNHFDRNHPSHNSINCPHRSQLIIGASNSSSPSSTSHTSSGYTETHVHHVIDGLTSSQHTTLFAHVQELPMTDINYLLPCHRHLLKQDFQQLGNADTLPRQLWVASMESAISAASHVASGHYTPGSMQVFNSRPNAPQARHNFTKQLYLSTRPPRTKRPVLQTLPSSFWHPSEALPIQPHPAQTHQTDFTGTRYHLHWRRK